LAAILASTCCLGPLVLVALGLSGAWIGNLTLLEPYRPFFIAGALIALFFAGRRIYRPVQTCNPGEVCAVPRTRRAYQVLFVTVSVLVLIALVFPNFPIATPQSQTQLMRKFLEIGNLPLNIGQFFFQTASHGGTRLQATPSQFQEVADFSQREPQVLGASNEA
jgi:mercuric ion transport protein